MHPGVRAGTRYVNGYVVGGGRDGLTVIDFGLPGYVFNVASTLDKIGRTPADVREVLLTQEHVDHSGLTGSLAEAGAEVYLHAADRHLMDTPGTGTTAAQLWRYAW